jgi:hypothetical protein
MMSFQVFGSSIPTHRIEFLQFLSSAGNSRGILAEFRIPDASGRICRNDVCAGIFAHLQVLRPYHVVLRTTLALQRPLNESLPEFRRNSAEFCIIFHSGATPGGAGIYPEFPADRVLEGAFCSADQTTQLTSSSILSKHWGHKQVWPLLQPILFAFWEGRRHHVTCPR